MRKLLPCLAAALAACLFGCAPDAGDAGSPAAEEPVRITSFSFSHRGSSAEECYSYSAEPSGDGALIRILLNAGKSELEFVSSPQVMDELCRIAAEHRLNSWNGFDKTDRAVMDGSSFTLDITLAGGSVISARGDNAFPPGYLDAVNEIRSVFEGLTGERAELRPAALDSDELRSVSLTLSGENGISSRRFAFSAREQQDGSIRLDIDLRGYEAMLPEEEYAFVGHCGSFPFDSVQQLVRKYDIPSWNGWDRPAEQRGPEWFELELSYRSGERITAMGSVYPNNYQQVRGELMELCLSFIRENRDGFTPWEG